MIPEKRRILINIALCLDGGALRAEISAQQSSHFDRAAAPEEGHVHAQLNKVDGFELNPFGCRIDSPSHQRRRQLFPRQSRRGLNLYAVFYGRSKNPCLKRIGRCLSLLELCNVWVGSQSRQCRTSCYGVRMVRYPKAFERSVLKVFETHRAALAKFDRRCAFTKRRNGFIKAERRTNLFCSCCFTTICIVSDSGQAVISAPEGSYAEFTDIDNDGDGAHVGAINDVCSCFGTDRREWTWSGPRSDSHSPEAAPRRGTSEGRTPRDEMLTLMKSTVAHGFVALLRRLLQPVFVECLADVGLCTRVAA